MKRIRTILLASVAAGISTAAMAADIAPAVKNPIAVVTAPYSWTGFYAGVDLGYGWTGLENGAVSFGGISLGGNVGYDYQIGSKIVVGGVVDGSYQGINGLGESSSLFDGTIRAKAGYLLTPSLLLYGTGGLAYFHGGSLLDNATAWGWTLGGGLEYALSQSWRIKTEWLHQDFGTVDHVSGVTDDVYRVGASYHF